MLTSHVQSLVCYDPETFLKVFCRRQACLRVIHHDIVSHNCLCPKIVTASLRPCIQGPHVCVCVEVAGMQAFVWYLCQWLLDLCLGKGFSFCFFFFPLARRSCPEDKFHICLSEKNMGGVSWWQKWSRAALLQPRLLLNTPNWGEEDTKCLQPSCFTCHTRCVVPCRGEEVNAGQAIGSFSAAGTAPWSSCLPKMELVQSCIPYWKRVFPGFWESFCSSGLVRSNSSISSSYLLFFPSLLAFCLLINRAFFPLSSISINFLLVGWDCWNP